MFFFGISQDPILSETEILTLDFGVLRMNLPPVLCDQGLLPYNAVPVGSVFVDKDFWSKYWGVWRKSDQGRCELLSEFYADEKEAVKEFEKRQKTVME